MEIAEDLVDNPMKKYYLDSYQKALADRVSNQNQIPTKTFTTAPKPVTKVISNVAPSPTQISIGGIFASLVTFFWIFLVPATICVAFWYFFIANDEDNNDNNSNADSDYEEQRYDWDYLVEVVSIMFGAVCKLIKMTCELIYKLTTTCLRFLVWFLPRIGNFLYHLSLNARYNLFIDRMQMYDQRAIFLIEKHFCRAVVTALALAWVWVLVRPRHMSDFWEPIRMSGLNPANWQVVEDTREVYRFVSRGMEVFYPAPTSSAAASMEYDEWLEEVVESVVWTTSQDDAKVEQSVGTNRLTETAISVETETSEAEQSVTEDEALTFWVTETSTVPPATRPTKTMSIRVEEDEVHKGGRAGIRWCDRCQQLHWQSIDE